MLPTAARVAKPELTQYGDYWGEGYSTGLASTPGWAMLYQAQTPLAAVPGQVSTAAPPPAANWMQTAGAGLILLALLALYFDGRLTR